MVRSSQWKPSGEDSMMSIWIFLRRSSSSWYSWVLLYFLGPKEGFWNLERLFNGDHWERPATRRFETQAQQPQGDLAVILAREHRRRCKWETVWYKHCTRFVTTHTFQSSWNKPGNPDPQQARARFDNVLSGKENPEAFALERQTNTEGIWFPSLTSKSRNLCLGTMECVCFTTWNSLTMISKTSGS